MRGRGSAVLVAALVGSAGLLPTPALAQGTRESAPVPGISEWHSPRDNQALPSSGQNPTLAPSPHQDTGSTSAAGPFLADAGTYAPRYDRSAGRWRSHPRVLYGYPPIVAEDVPSATVAPARRPEAEPEGRLRLRVTPGSAQVFVDGLYVGIADDFNGDGLVLETGPRRVELRAGGYDTVTFDVRIVAGETIHYRKDLERPGARPKPPQVAAVARTFYVIPRCYAGDTPPRRDHLPAGCLLSDLRTVLPFASASRNP